MRLLSPETCGYLRRIPINTNKPCPMADIVKTLTLAPGDPGPTCSYSPYCSPTNLTTWRKATYLMIEEELPIPPNTEIDLVQRWIVQLIQRELTWSLPVAEKRVRHELNIEIDDATAALINTALELRAQRQRTARTRRARRRRRGRRAPRE